MRTFYINNLAAFPGKYQTCPVTCYYWLIVTNNNNNSQVSDQDLEPTLELEPLSEEDCARLMLAESSNEPSEIEDTQRNFVAAEAPLSEEAMSDIHELRDALKFRDEMNSILQLGIDQQREKCSRLTRKVSDLQEYNKELKRELEQSRNQLTKSKKKLAKARESEQALLINLKTLGKSDTNNRIIADQNSAIEELSRDNQQLTESVSKLEFELELARQAANRNETQLNEANRGNEKLSAQLESRGAQIDDYDRQLAARQTRSAVGVEESPQVPSSVDQAPNGQDEHRWMLVSLDESLPDTYALRDGVVVVGNSRDCDIHIQSQFISRHHAQLVNTDKGCVLGDLNSTNGTFVNARRITKRILRAGDVVTIGKHRFRFEERPA